MEPLFEVELQYQKEKAKVTDSESKVAEGKYLASGIGTIKGNQVEGTVSWDLFENSSEQFCDAHFAGIIETQNDVHVNFDVFGFFLKTEGSIWRLKASVIFHADATQYSWLNSPLMFWEGHFDMGTYHHYYKVYSSFNDS